MPPGTSPPVPLSLQPMEAEPVDDLPSEPGWSFEPKYDGFRCVVFRDGDSVHLQSRRQRPLARFFPEVAAAIAALRVPTCVLDGELVIRGAGFDALQLRLHPAASRIARLSRETPASFVAFDLLADATGTPLLAQPFAERRHALEALFRGWDNPPGVALAESTHDRDAAYRWLRDVGHGLDGIVAKRLDLPYRPGERAMLKYKLQHTIDCVVGGVYRHPDSDAVQYLLLGLYDSAGRLNYVGRCPPRDASVARRLHPLLGGTGFTGSQPGGRSRWSKRERIATPLRPDLVVEVAVDTVTAGKFRHGARLLRWRDDKPPHACTLQQIEPLRPKPGTPPSAWA
jgi:ATP-dependent DNA ligase